MNNLNMELQDIRASLQKIVGEEKELILFKMAVNLAKEMKEGNISTLVISILKNNKQILLM